jgi:hypothetical protein
VQTAERFAVAAHEGQTDKAGRPYIEHPRRVARRLDTPEALAAAFLHDVLEDTEHTAADLAALERLQWHVDRTCAGSRRPTTTRWPRRSVVVAHASNHVGAAEIERALGRWVPTRRVDAED